MFNFIRKTKSESKKPFNWTKIHLVYFALAGFDLLAVGTGLGLAEWSKKAHNHTIDVFDQSSFLRDEVALSDKFANQITSLASNALNNGNFAKLRAVNVKLRTELENKFSSAAIDLRLRSFIEKEAKTHAEYLVANQKLMASAAAPNLVSDLPTALFLLDRKTLSRFSASRQATIANLNAMLMAANESLEATAEKNPAKMALASEKLLRSHRSLSEENLATSYDLTEISEDALKAGQTIIARANWLQYAIAGAIFLMIALACAYAAFVGNILRRKHAELETAHAETMAHGLSLKQSHDDVIALNVDLAQKMKQLQDAQDELLNKAHLEQLGKLTATVAHELRNPLGSMRTSAFLLERKIKGKALDIEPQIDRITKGITRCDHIIGQLLDFSRTTAINADVSDLDQWLEKIIVEEAAGLPHVVSITCNLGLHGEGVAFDPDRLSRAIINLLSNASEALVGKGKITLDPNAPSPHIHVKTTIADGQVLISVSDNGPGIPVELLTKIREPLFTTKSFGTGLGIPAIEQIAKQHGGSLGISSDPGHGATFTIFLPATKPSELAA